MGYLIKTGRIFYATALVVYGLQQFYFSSFRNVFFSAYQDYLPFPAVFAWLFGIYLVATALLIIAGKKARPVSLSLGFMFLLLFMITQVPYEIFTEPYSHHLALWVNPLKEFALAGGAFVVAGTFQNKTGNNRFMQRLDNFIPWGNLFFCITMTCFGIIHLVLGARLEHLVPSWCRHPLFWVYFTGVALIGSGVTIMLGIRIRVISLLLALMIFTWFWIVHIPAAVNSPFVDRGNLLASAFDALAFTGIALMVACTVRNQKWISTIENWK